MNSGSFVVFHLITHRDAYWLPFIFHVLLPPKFPFPIKGTKACFQNGGRAKFLSGLGNYFAGG